MDGSMDSVKTCDEAIKLYKELSELWGKAGMHPRKWISNESEVLKEIPEEDRAMEVNLKCGEFPYIKTLIILWKASDDVFTFKDASDPCCKEDKHTKRSFLKKIATLFDLLGFLSPYVLQGNMGDWLRLGRPFATQYLKESNELVERIRNTIKFSSSKMLTMSRESF